MLRISAIILVLVTLLTSGSASERAVTYTVQALAGLAGDTPRFDKVYCHDKYAFSGEPTYFSFITLPYFPPTYDKGGRFDHNLLSASKIEIQGALAESGKVVTIDATKIEIPKELFEGSKFDLISFSLECVRMTAELHGCKDYSVVLIAPDDLKAVSEELRLKYLKHDKSKPFVSHPAEEPSM